MSSDASGQLAALLAAVTWSTGLVFFRLSCAHIGPIALNLFKNAVALTLFAITLLAVPGTLEAMTELTLSEWIVLAISGILGIAMADTVFFWALGRLGVGLIAVVDCAYSPMVVLFAWIMLNERLAPSQLAGGALILAAVVVVSSGRRSLTATAPPLLAVAAAILAVTLMAYGIVLATPVLRDHANVPALLVMTTTRLLAGTVALAMLTPLSNERGAAWRAFRPSRSWRLSVPAAVIGTFVCLIFWVAGFTYTSAGVAALLNQSSLIWSMLLASLLLREPFGRRRLIASGLAGAGIVLVSWRAITAGT